MSKEKFTDYRVISIGDKDYPKNLAKIKDAPRKLYLRGNLPDPKKKSVAIVGARNCTDYGSTLADTISRVLSAFDVQVISGLAMGIDTQAHIGSIEVNKPTFAVMGCGVDICFPSHNSNVYEKILENGGGIMAEVETGTPPLPYNFPLRNRIISGLSDAVIMVESREKSASLITTDFALEQNKPIFACAGSLENSLSEGPNNLIKQGAYVLTNPTDVLDMLGINYENFYSKVKIDCLNSLEKRVFDALKDETKHIDQIAEETGLPISLVSNTILSLKMLGFIESTINNYYRINSDYIDYLENKKGVEELKNGKNEDIDNLNKKVNKKEVSYE